MQPCSQSLCLIPYRSKSHPSTITRQYTYEIAVNELRYEIIKYMKHETKVYNVSLGEDIDVEASVAHALWIQKPSF